MYPTYAISRNLSTRIPAHPKWGFVFAKWKSQKAKLTSTPDRPASCCCAHVLRISLEPACQAGSAFEHSIQRDLVGHAARGRREVASRPQAQQDSATRAK